MLEMSKLGDILNVRRGTTITKKDTVEGDVPVIGGGTKPTYYHNKPNRDGGCITISGSGASAGYVNMWSMPIHASDCSTVEPKDKEHLKSFIFYYLQAQQDFIYKNFRSGAAQPHVYAKDIAKLDYPILPLSEQKRIVAKLDKAFAEIDIAIKVAESNAKNAEVLFQNYLIKVFEHDGKRWETKKINDVANLIDSLHRTPNYIDEGLPMVRVIDIKVGKLNLSKTKKVDQETFNEFSKRHIPKIGDIVFSRVGSYGVSAIVNSEEKFCLGQNTVFIIPKINPIFLFYFLNSTYAKKQFNELKSGVAQPTISLKSIKSVTIPIPQEKEMKKLVIKFEEFYKQANILKEGYIDKLQELKNLNQSILEKLLMG